MLSKLLRCLYAHYLFLGFFRVYLSLKGSSCKVKRMNTFYMTILLVSSESCVCLIRRKASSMRV